MRQTTRGLAALFVACAAQTSLAVTELADLWYDPAVPGRGVSIHAQGSVLFATFYTYDGNGRPTWYVASDVRSTGVDFDGCGTAHWAGTLHAAQGPALGATTPPLTAREVGTISFASLSVPACANYNRLDTQVTIDGARTSIALVRQTWSSDIPEGRYLGALNRAAPCDGVTGGTTGPIDISRTGSSVKIAITSQQASCEINGTLAPNGSRAEIVGAQTCFVGTTGFSRAVTVQDFVVNNNGFSGVIADTSNNNPRCSNARIAGVRRFP